MDGLTIAKRAGLPLIIVTLSMVAIVVYFMRMPSGPGDDSVANEKARPDTKQGAFRSGDQRRGKDGEASENRSGDSPVDAQVGIRSGIGGLPAVTVTSSGELPTACARELGMSEQQTASVQALLTTFWKAQEQLVAARAYRDDNASDADAKRDVFRIPADADRGKSRMDALEKGIAGVVGPAIAERLVKGMSHEPFGGFGNFDVVVTFEPDHEFIAAGMGDDSIRVTYVYRDPKSGARVLEGNSTLESFQSIFGHWEVKALPE